MYPTADKISRKVMESVPDYINDAEILQQLQSNKINWQHVLAIKQTTDFNDDIISEWLNVSVKTFREYKKPHAHLKENTREHVLLLLSVIKHGISVFGSVTLFENWLKQKNIFFDQRSPMTFMNTITGIKLIDDRLTAMEYGDNI